MGIFKIKGTAIEELPELEIEASSLEEAQDKYLKKFEEGEIEGECFEIDFDDE